MGKTSKTKVENKPDPRLAAESGKAFDLVRAIADIGYQPFTGNLFADFTEGQKAAFANADSGASAFGMDAGLVGGGPQGATEGAYGISGFSPQTVMEAEQPNWKELTDAIQGFFTQAGSGNAPKQRGGNFNKYEKRGQTEGGIPQDTAPTRIGGKK